MIIKLDPTNRYPNLVKDDILSILGITLHFFQAAEQDLQKTIKSVVEQHYGQPIISMPVKWYPEESSYQYKGDAKAYPLLEIELPHGNIYAFPYAIFVIEQEGQELITCRLD